LVVARRQAIHVDRPLVRHEPVLLASDEPTSSVMAKGLLRGLLALSLEEAEAADVAIGQGCWMRATSRSPRRPNRCAKRFCGFR
jgi:hypothetical protein